MEILEENPDKISIGQNVLLMMPSGNSKLIKLKDDRIALGKFGTFNTIDLIGRYYETSYEITRDGIKRATEFDIHLTNTDATNQFINDDSEAGQKLSQIQIEALKKDGLDGIVNHHEIIQTLVDNNSTFKEKTQFSQKKYIERKERK
jgi:tRNA (adenine-N(1)-)-methyltransferase non-catalytic subunit